jgi:hypothetical protein
MSKARSELEAARDLVSEELPVDKEPVPNTITEDTGPLDPRFALWRSFCAEHGVPVETLPGDLEETLKGQWKGLKEEEIHAPVEGRT